MDVLVICPSNSWRLERGMKKKTVDSNGVLKKVIQEKEPVFSSLVSVTSSSVM